MKFIKSILLLLCNLSIPVFVFLSLFKFVNSQDVQSPFIINEISGNVFTKLERNNYGLFPFNKEMEYAELFNNHNGKIDAKIFVKNSNTYLTQTDYTPEIISEYYAYIDRLYNSKNGDLFAEQGSNVVIKFDDGNELLTQIISVRDSSFVVAKNKIENEKDLSAQSNSFLKIPIKDINSIVIKIKIKFGQI